MQSRVTVYAICWNEIFMLPHFFKHYDWAEKIVICDNGSDDGSQEFVKNHPKGELRHFDSGGVQDNRYMIAVKNNCWKGDTSDWVVVCDVDEFLVGYEKLDEYLGQECIFESPWYQMVSMTVPDDLKSIKLRVLYKWWNVKCICFSPKINEINYRLGAHSCRPIPNNIIKNVLEVNHYSYLGVDYLINRWKRYANRMGPHDRNNNICTNYLMDEDQIRAEFNKVIAKCKRRGQLYNA